MNQESLDGATQILPDLWSIQNILNHVELETLLHEITKETRWECVDLQQHLQRTQIVWQANGICDWLFCKLQELDFSKFGLTFRTAVIWQDKTGYTIGKHTDNSRVVAAMQIYLSATYPKLGTWFQDIIEIPFVQNTGYLMHNRNGCEHGMKSEVPPGYSRISFYTLFDIIL